MSTRSVTPATNIATVTPIVPAVVETPAVKTVKVAKVTKAQAIAEQDRRVGVTARTPFPAQHIMQTTNADLAAKAGRKAPAKVVNVVAEPVLGFVDTQSVEVVAAAAAAAAKKAEANAAFVAALAAGEGKAAARLAFKNIISA